MKILKILGIIIIVLIVMPLWGFWGLYSVKSGYQEFEFGGPQGLRLKTESVDYSCLGKNITFYDEREVDGDALFFCIGFIKKQ